MKFQDGIVNMEVAEMNTEQDELPNWINRRSVAERLDIPVSAVAALVRRGLIRTRDLPVRARYNAEDVDRLAGVAGAGASITVT